MGQWQPKKSYTAAPRSPTTLAALGFVFLYALLICILGFISRRDPSSLFFSETHAYNPNYSAYRTDQAKHFLEHYPDAAHRPKWSPVHDATLCLGISSSLEAAEDLYVTLGSLLHGMSEAEREKLHIKVMVPHTDPNRHPALRETWLVDIADSILLYSKIQSVEQIDQLRMLEAGPAEDKAKKRTMDFQLLMKECFLTGAPYVLMLEDGVVAADGWLQRTLAALEDIEGHSNGNFYLRLFHTETLLGWDFERHWMAYTFWSAITMAMVPTCLLLLRKYKPRSRKATNMQNAAWIAYVAVPALILLFFAAGRNTMMPLRTGIAEMKHYDGRAQGLALPRRQAIELVSWYDKHLDGDLETSLQQHAETHACKEFAMVPSVVQNAGSKVSGNSEWNFRFEQFDAKKLRREHEHFLLHGWVKHIGL